MCLGIPGQVASFDSDHPDIALVDVAGATQRVNMGILEDTPQVGDWIVIHMGHALETISEDEARAALDVLNTLGPNAGGEPVFESEAPPGW